MDFVVGFVAGAPGVSVRPGFATTSKALVWRSSQKSKRCLLRMMADEEINTTAESVEGAEGAGNTIAEATEDIADTITEDADPAPEQARARGGNRNRKRRDLKYQIQELTVGMEVEGTVRSTTKYGAFVDIGCSTDGLIHVSQLSSDYVERVEDVVKQGDTVNARIIAVNPDKNEFSLTLKPASDENSRSSQGRGGNRNEDRAQWNTFSFDPKTFISGKVVSVTDYGAFVDVDGPTDGMVHISEMADSRVESVESILAVGDDIEVRIVEVDPSRRRISLSMVEYKEPGEEEQKISASKQAIQDANSASETSVEFRSAFEIALEQARSKTKSKV
eukprot:Plantae.Rhodophyta-Purpureofilum_apyrenoidigerum.ctg1518.p1 GENE.Plantae.Rhodophyta-Purpureofilum_apyrenoidigerum.ctg1518~~Plantae.Rhodophyta-Purpureofilum_apyrenoidigerum.ctg1518.p1  ORF type:complete len:333 (+),score=73.52 Plantae.Rhodophyta-Purpureofilum_apyrenoidigerum.ctg1518:135-1133(+)